MARTKGALNKKTLEKMNKSVAATGTAPIAVENNKRDEEEGCKMQQTKKVVVPINKELMVEGFNPDSFKQYYDDGTAYLPFKVQLAWFRLRYPNGKTPVFRPEWSMERTPGTYVATARVYKDASDPVDNYLSEASAKKGPDTKIVDTEISIDAYNDVQRAALSMALRFAGFWCSLTEEDLSKELKTDTPVSNTPDQTKSSKEKTKAETPVKEQKTETPAQTEALVEEQKAEVPVQTESPVEEQKTETPAQTEAPVEEQKAEVPVQTEAPVEEQKAEVPVQTEASVEEQKTETPAQTETPVKEQKDETPAPTEAPVEEQKAEVPVQTEAPVEEQKTETPAPTETPVEEQKTEVPTPTDTPVEEQKDETPAPTEAPVEEQKDEETIKKEEAELEELRAIPFTNGYYNGTVGDLEQRLIAFKEGNQSSDNNTDELFVWLLNSNMAKRRFPKEVAAANRIAELRHPDWKAQ